MIHAVRAVTGAVALLSVAITGAAAQEPAPSMDLEGHVQHAPHDLPRPADGVVIREEGVLLQLLQRKAMTLSGSVNPALLPAKAGPAGSLPKLGFGRLLVGRALAYSSS